MPREHASARLLKNPSGQLDNPCPWAYPANAQAEACQHHANTSQSTRQGGRRRRRRPPCRVHFHVLAWCWHASACAFAGSAQIIEYTINLWPWRRVEVVSKACRNLGFRHRIEFSTHRSRCRAFRDVPEPSRPLAEPKIYFLNGTIHLWPWDNSY